MVATARIVGEICSRMPFHICRGMVCWSWAATKSTTTTSSKEVTKAKSAPEITPGMISGMVTLKKVVVGEAPRLSGGAVERLVEADERRGHGDDDEGDAERGMGEDDADVGVPARPVAE